VSLPAIAVFDLEIWIGIWWFNYKTLRVAFQIFPQVETVGVRAFNAPVSMFHTARLYAPRPHRQTSRGQRTNWHQTFIVEAKKSRI
jgi:hypothetical protein